ncbi:MAG: OmpA family protein [Sulfitobacter sp.]
MRSILKTTTSLALCMSLALPGGAWAQSAKPCGNGDNYPCKMKIGDVVNSRVEMLEKRISHLDGQRTEAIQNVVRLRDAEKDTTKAMDALHRVDRLLDEANAQLTRARIDADKPQPKPKKQNAKDDKKPKKDKKDKDNKKDKKDKKDKNAKDDKKTKAERKAEQEARDKAERRKERKAEERRAQAEQEARQERRRARRESAAASGREAAEVRQQRLSREDVRASDQEFEKDDDGGLSNLEKALLLGLGAAVVGQVLKNGDKVVSNSGDRVIVERDGELHVLKDDDALLRQPGSDVKTETFSDGSTRTTVDREDGSRIVTIRAADGSVLRRSRIGTDGQEVLLFDDTVAEQEVIVSQLPQIKPRPVPDRINAETDLRAALAAEQALGSDRQFSLRQVREISQVRALAPEIELDAVRFPTGSAAIQPAQARSLSRLGTTLADMIADNPRTVFLVEGHTDAVGDATYNLSLSDRRAETVALALTEYFDVPPENLITQGYGESALKVPTTVAEPANRRAVVRNITDLLR